MSDPCEECGLEPPEHDDDGCPEVCDCGDLHPGGCCPDAACWWECRATAIAENAGDRRRDGDAA